MNLVDLVKDTYERKARLYPALLLIAPAALTVAALLSANLSSFESVGVAIMGCGGAFLLTQLVRDAGKKIENKLFAEWNGLPSVSILRHRDRRVDVITKSRYHEVLAAKVNGTHAPTAAEETVNPEAADDIYRAWSTYLRSITRDTKQYALLFKENVNYGYRRNILGLRSTGIWLSFGCTLVCAARIYWDFHFFDFVNTAVIDGAVFSGICFILWAFRFTSTWVRVPADAYAERLIESLDNVVLK